MKNYTFTLTSTSLILGSGGITLPATVTLNSSAASRAIQLSTDKGINYFTPPTDAQSTEVIVLVIASKFSNIKVTGSIGDIVTVTISI